MRRALVAILLGGAAACGDGSTTDTAGTDPSTSAADTLPEAPATRDVVDAALAALPSPPEPPPLANEARSKAEGLLEFVAESRGDMRRVGAEDLWRHGDALAPWLRDAALDEARGDAVRGAALEVLGAGDAQLVGPYLLDLLTNGVPSWVRSSAAWYLGEGGSDGWICDAVLRLKYETDESVVVYIAQALGKVDVLAGLSGLRVISRSSWSEEQRATAEAVIEELTAESSATDREPHARTPRFDAAVWGWIARLAEFQLRGVDDARFVLTNLGADVAPHLAQALFDDDRYVRLHACQCLERMGTKAVAAVDALLEQLGSPDLGPQAAVTLGVVSDGDRGARVRTALVELMRNEAAAPGLRLGATRGLAHLADPKAVNALLDQFELEAQRWPELAQAVAEALVTTRALEAHAGDGSERDGRIAAAYRFAVASLDTPGLDPASTGVAWETAFAAGPIQGLEDVPEAWDAIGAKRGPEFDAIAMWRERKALLERALAEVLGG